MAKQRPTLQQARNQYPHRFTCEHVPQWARKVRPDGTFYAPQYATDAEWYANTVFPEEGFPACRDHCYSARQTWPLGHALPTPYTRSHQPT